MQSSFWSVEVSEIRKHIYLYILKNLLNFELNPVNHFARGSGLFSLFLVGKSTDCSHEENNLKSAVFIPSPSPYPPRKSCSNRQENLRVFQILNFKKAIIKPAARYARFLPRRMIVLHHQILLQNPSHCFHQQRHEEFQSGK